MQVFADKTILIISPQPWGIMFVAKHHYARELASQGNRVYFINPPAFSTSSFARSSKADVLENVQVVDHGTYIPTGLRFHFRRLYDLLMRQHIRFLLRKLFKDQESSAQNKVKKTRTFSASLNHSDPLFYFT